MHLPRKKTPDNKKKNPIPPPPLMSLTLDCLVGWGWHQLRSIKIEGYSCDPLLWKPVFLFSLLSTSASSCLPHFYLARHFARTGELGERNIWVELFFIYSFLDFHGHKECYQTGNCIEIIKNKIFFLIRSSGSFS